MAKTSRRASAACPCAKVSARTRDLDGLVGVQGLNEIAAELGMVLIHDRDGYAAQQLAEIGLRVEETVEDGREHDEAEHASIVEDATPFGDHRDADAAPRPARLRIGGGLDGATGLARAMARRRNQARPNSKEASPPRMMNGSAEIAGGKPRTAWSNRICIYHRRRQHAPQNRAKSPIASTGKPTPAKPNAGLQIMAMRLMPVARLRDQELEQAAQRQIGDHQQARRGPHQQGAAAERHLEEPRG